MLCKRCKHPADDHDWRVNPDGGQCSVKECTCAKYETGGSAGPSTV